MREITFSYDTKEKGISGEFTRSIPTMEEMDLDPENVQHSSLYWGWFRQVQVTLRAQAKRLREGNKSQAAKSADEVARIMQSVKLPTYDEPGEQQDKVEKVAAIVEKMTPADIARLRAALGITVHEAR